MGPDQPIVPQPALEDSAAFIAIPTYLARHAEFRDSLPRCTIGKIMKRELGAPCWQGRGAKI